jgi:hypothetical protein
VYHGYRATFPKWDPEDRFTALEEVRALLKSRLVNVDCMIEVLCRCNDGCIDFNLGDIAIQFVRGFGVWSERRDVIQMTIELWKGDAGEVMCYEYSLAELVKSHFLGENGEVGDDTFMLTFAQNK